MSRRRARRRTSRRPQRRSLDDRLHQGIRRLRPHATRRVEVFGEAQFRLLGGCGRGVAAAARVHHKQVNGVRPDVEHPEAHTGGYRRA